MAKVLCEIELKSGQRARLMGATVRPADHDEGKRMNVRLVFVNWEGDVPRIVAEYSEHTDALGSPVWQPADKLPLPLVLAALGDVVRGIDDPRLAARQREGHRADERGRAHANEVL